MGMRCPKCKSSSFSVSVRGWQSYNGEFESYGSIEDTEDEGGVPYLCLECNAEYALDELEEYNPNEVEVQTKIE